MNKKEKKEKILKDREEGGLWPLMLNSNTAVSA